MYETNYLATACCVDATCNECKEIKCWYIVANCFQTIDTIVIRAILCFIRLPILYNWGTRDAQPKTMSQIRRVSSFSYRRLVIVTMKKCSIYTTVDPAVPNYMQSLHKGRFRQK